MTTENEEYKTIVTQLAAACEAEDPEKIYQINKEQIRYYNKHCLGNAYIEEGCPSNFDSLAAGELLGELVIDPYPGIWGNIMKFLKDKEGNHRTEGDGPDILTDIFEYLKLNNLSKYTNEKQEV